MLSITSILLWTSFLMQVAIASPGDEGDHTLGLRSPENPDSRSTPYNVATNVQAVTANDDGSPIAPRAVVNTRRASATAASRSAADASLGQMADGLTTVVIAGSLIWTFAM
ncbi:hypothetical protein Q9L58_003297 [Maublancomyces gigas]|uniref:Uncharacterized protein n=1 Tax=Discina gigas TaxID=1032678 RepID=A0ABR3GPS6_9PEZI